MQSDLFGSRMLRIQPDTSQPSILWSCHVDTVAAKGGPQSVCVDAHGIAALSDRKPGRSLGADDGVGVWLMLEMIEAGIPGLYVFHRGEEKGCLGSRWIVKNTPNVLNGIEAAIAFDRAGNRDIITHQSYGRTCSDEFALSLAIELNNQGTGLDMMPDDTGVYTDTNEYAHCIPECTNVSVGYLSNHGPNETCDLNHCARLLDAVLTMDMSELVIARDPIAQAEEERFDYGWGRQVYSTTSKHSNDMRDLIDLVEDNPTIVATLLVSIGYSVADLEAHIYSQQDPQYADDIPWYRQ
ncbi:M28 family peptidase [Aquisediminimonas sediminicola]|uniref:M28 family peptidase n=1 Tax=Alteraquisediminimonas sediminicola TaxID=2676787 RepID=UPI0031B817BF